MSSPRGLSARDGISLVELMIAVMIFTVASLIGGRFVVQFIHQVGVSEARALATEFAVEELERVKLRPYEDIGPIAAGPIPADPSYRRGVAVTEVGEDDPTALYSYRMITVTVSPPGNLDPVRVSTAVSP